MFLSIDIRFCKGLRAKNDTGSTSITQTVSADHDGCGRLRWSGPNRDGGRRDEGHRAGRGQRYPVASDHPGGVQAAAAGLRQADDLLPAVGAVPGRHPGDPDHLHPDRPAQLPAAAGQRQPVRRALRLRGAGAAQRAGRGVRDRRGLHRRRRRGAGAGRQHLLRPGLLQDAAAARCDAGRLRAVRLPGEGPGALRRRRGRRGRAAGVASRRSRRSRKSNKAITGLYFYDNEVVDDRARRSSRRRAASWRSPTST